MHLHFSPLFLGLFLISLVFSSFFFLRLNLDQLEINAGLQPLFIRFYKTTPFWTMRWSWSLDAWRILINPIRSWSPWFRRILNPLIFRNKPSLNRNWVSFVLHQKRKLAPEKEIDYASENALYRQLVLKASRLARPISWLIGLLVNYCKLLPLCILPL